MFKNKTQSIYNYNKKIKQYLNIDKTRQYLLILSNLNIKIKAFNSIVYKLFVVHF